MITIINPTLYRGGTLSAPPPKVLVSGAFQSELRDPKCWHYSYIILRIILMKTKFSKFFQFCFQFFQFFGHPPHTKRFLCTFGQHIHLTPKKGLFYKVSWKWLKISTFVWTSYCALGWVKFDISKVFAVLPGTL